MYYAGLSFFLSIRECFNYEIWGEDMKNKPKVAIIDDGINLKLVTKYPERMIYLADKASKISANCYSHGTIIAKIIEKSNFDYDLIDINIFSKKKLVKNY